MKCLQIILLLLMKNIINNFSSYIIELENFYDNIFIDEIELIKENDISIIILLFYFSIYKYITNIFNKLETINESQFKLVHYLKKLKYLINLFQIKNFLNFENLMDH